jgi:pyruvate/2-oxoglutarate dehydrogenase complex dihydrolipoamide acyltransferase (E2) component
MLRDWAGRLGIEARGRNPESALLRQFQECLPEAIASLVEEKCVRKLVEHREGRNPQDVSWYALAFETVDHRKAREELAAWFDERKKREEGDFAGRKREWEEQRKREEDDRRRMVADGEKRREGLRAEFSGLFGQLEEYAGQLRGWHERATKAQAEIDRSVESLGRRFGDAAPAAEAKAAQKKPAEAKAKKSRKKASLPAQGPDAASAAPPEPARMPQAGHGISLENACAAIERIYRELSEAQCNRHICIFQVRRQSGLPRDLFDQAIARLAREYKIDLHIGEHSYFREEDRRDAYHNPRQNVTYYLMSWR